MRQRRGLYSRPTKPAIRILPSGPYSTAVAAGVLRGSFGEAFTWTQPATSYLHSTAGVLTSFAADTPRVESNGFLIEVSRANVVSRSEDIAGGWTANQVSYTNPATPTDPTGGTGTRMMTDTAVDAIHGSFVSHANTIGSNFVLSCYAKAGTADRFGLSLGNGGSSPGAWWNLTTGVVGGTFGVGTAAYIEALANGWYRCSVACVTVQTPQFPFIRMGTADAHVSTYAATYVGSGSTLYLFGAQLEAGTRASSYIRTTAGGVTKAGDSCRISTTGFPVLAGEVSLEYTPKEATGGLRTLYDTCNGGNGVNLAITASNELQLKTELAAASDMTASSALTWTPGTTYRIRARWGYGRHDVWRNDVLVASAGSLTNLPTAQHSLGFFGTDTSGANGCHGNLSNVSLRAV